MVKRTITKEFWSCKVLPNNIHNTQYQSIHPTRIQQKSGMAFSGVVKFTFKLLKSAKDLDDKTIPEYTLYLLTTPSTPTLHANVFNIKNVTISERTTTCTWFDVSSTVTLKRLIIPKIHF